MSAGLLSCCLPIVAVQFRCAPLTAGHGCAGSQRTGLVASSSTAFRSTRTLCATGWARCASRGSGVTVRGPSAWLRVAVLVSAGPGPETGVLGKSCFDSVRVLADHSGPTRWGTPLHSGSNRLRLTLHGDSRAGSYGGARLNTLFLSITGQPATSLRCVQPCPTSAATPTSAVSLRLRRPLPAFRSTPPALRLIVARRQTGGHSHAVRVLRRSPGYRPALCSGPAVTAPPRASANPSRPGTTAAPCRPESHPWPERPASMPG